LGYRKPSRLVLITLLRALEADLETRNEILEAAGCSREGAADADANRPPVR
jgi:hypothetical protein